MADTTIKLSGTYDSIEAYELLEEMRGVASDYLPLTGGEISGDLIVDGQLSATLTGNVTGTASGNLPLSGGTMTGTLTIGNDAKARGLMAQNGTTCFRIASGEFTYANAGAFIHLFSNTADTNAGNFQISAHTSSAEKALVGKSDGTLTWAGKEVERVNASGSNYIRFESGLQICFASVSASNAGTSATFPVAFSSNPVITVSAVNSNTTAWVTNLSTTGFSAHTQSGAWLWYIAIGRY